MACKCVQGLGPNGCKGVLLTNFNIERWKITEFSILKRNKEGLAMSIGSVISKVW